MILQVPPKFSTSSNVSRTSFLNIRFCSGLLAIAGFVTCFSPGAIATVEPESIRQPSIQLAQAAGNSREAAQLLQQGAIQFQKRQWKEAEASWQEALKLYRQSKDRAGEGRVLGNLAAIQEAQENYTQAIALFQQSLTIAREIKDLRGESFALTNLAYMYKNVGNFKQAIAHLEAALPIIKATQDVEGEYHAFNQLGIVHRAMGNYEQAIAVLTQSLTVAQKLGNKPGEANVLGNLANTLSEQGNYPTALTNYQKSLELMRQVENPVGEAGVLQRLGSLYSQLGDRTTAVKYLQQSLEIAQKIKNRRLEAYNLGNLGSVYYNTGQPQKALEYLRPALAIMQQLGDRDSEGSLLQFLGNAYESLGDYKQAKTQYEQSLVIARDLGKKSGEGSVLGSLAILYDQMQENEKAIALYQDAIDILQKIGDRPSEGKALSNMGMTLFEMDRLEEAEKALVAAISIWESLRPGLSDANQISLFETQAATYRALQKVLIRRKQHSQALEISERSRARAFIELVAKRFSAQLATKLQTSLPTLNELQQIARQQKSTLVQYSILDAAQLAIWVIQPDGTIHFRETVLPEDSASIPELAEQTRVAVVMGRGGQSSETGVTSLVRETRSAIQTETVQQESAQQEASNSKNGKRRLNRKLQTLHRVLIQPIADLLPTDPNAQVVLIPQGTLFLVPFAALQDAKGTFLIEQHTLRIAPSIQVLGFTHTRRSQLKQNAQSRDRASALIVGNPAMPKVGDPPEALSPLPHAEQEAKTIADILKTQAKLGQQATEEVVAQQMTNAKLLHFATHGLLDDLGGVGIPGAIALAPTASSDGLLTSNEILQTSLNNAELVVLSACDTGGGQITGDGVIGLARSFISSGAPSLVVSLWAVSDDATATLMTAFYQNLQQTPNKAQALRQAMLTTMQQYPHSRDWAAFTLVGEAD